ncbi:hypothetical protein C2W62_07070 [Candidatus Entotheonella serta]|nr:hypothetical protein C2W62_07070 [Candidatus Entotheonella serta]
MAGKFEIKRAKDGQFYFNLKARNGEIILTSEMYTTKANTQKGVASVMTNALLDQRFERKVSRRDDPYFALKAANGEPIGVSEMYSSRSAMENGVESVKHNAPEARIEDLTVERS